MLMLMLMGMLGALAVGQALAQSAYLVVPLGGDAERAIDRYQVTVPIGGTFWDLASHSFPLLALEEGDARVIELVEKSWRQQYPERAAHDIQPGDTFAVEVPAGTFVAKSSTRSAGAARYTSFEGDEVTTYPRDPTVQYKLRRAVAPDRAEVILAMGMGSAIDVARVAYEIHPPDFIQVRVARGAIQERTGRLSVDLRRRHLDEFREYRDRATTIELLANGLHAYVFDPSDVAVPFVRVDDGVGDETDPSAFPRLFRVAYLRDGTIRRFLITEAGDTLGALEGPENGQWSPILPQWQEWQPGQPEALAPFTPAVNAAGTLLPGRILVMVHRPREAPVVARPAPNQVATGAECLGIPIGAVLALLPLLLRGRVPFVGQ